MGSSADVTGTLTFIGTATTLLRYGGFTLLTDPNFLHRGQRAYLGKGLSSARRTEPAMSIADLPPLDAVVLSHLHEDHFDRIARDELPKDVPVVTTIAGARELRSWGFADAVGLTTWQVHELHAADGSRLRITAAPGRHARGPLQALLPPVNGHVLEFSPADAAPLSVYITGDTLLVDDLRQVPVRHPDLDLGLWHLGGTRIPRRARARRARDHGRAGGRRPARDRPAAHHRAGPLRRLRRVHQPAVGLPGGGRAARADRACGRSPAARRCPCRRPDRPPMPAEGAVHSLPRRCRTPLALSSA